MRKAILILLLVLLVVSAAIAVTWQAKSETVMADARSMLEQEVTKALGSQASVDMIKIQGLSSVAVTGIRLLDQQGELLATAERLTVVFNPLALLMGSNPMDAIHRVAVESPRLYLRQRADLSWNLDDLTQSKGKDGQAFSGLVSISRGWVSVETRQQGTYQADNLNGELDFAVKPSIQLDLKGSHRGAWFVVTGSVNGSTRDVLTISIDSLSLPAYQAVLPSQSLQITAGQARHATVTVVREQETLSYSGEAYIQDLAAQVDDLRIDHASALVSFDHNTLHVYNGNLHIWDQPVRVSGNILYHAAQPVFDVELISDAFESACLPVPADIEGQAAFSAHVQGTQSDFQAQGRLTAAAGRYEQYQFTQAATQFVYHNGLLRLIGAKAQLYGGHLTADGIIDMDSMTADLRLSGQGLDGAVLALAAGLPDTGADIDFDMLLNGKVSLAEMNLTGTVTLGAGKAAGVAFDSGYGGFHLRQGVFTAEYFHTVVKSGTLSAKGSYDMNRDMLAIDVDSHHLPLEALTETLPDSLRASGSLEFTARLSGTLAEPQMMLALTAEAGSILSQPYERLTGTMAITGDRVLLQDILVVNGSTEHTIAGNIQLTGAQNLDLTIASRHARMENLLKPLSLTEVVTGNVDNELTVTGTLDNPAVAGQLTLADGSWRGYLLTGVKGAYSLRNGLITLDDVVINSLDNHLAINGTVTTQGKLALDVIGDAIDLARLPAPYPYPVNGKAKLAVRLMGTVDQPQMTGEMTIPRMNANGQVFENVEAALDWDGVVLHCPQARFSQGPSVFNLTGGMNLQSNEIYGSLRVEKAQASSIAALANIDDQMLQGEINGHFTWSGNLTNPNAAFSGTVVNGIVKGYTIGNIEMEAVLANRVIDLNKMMVTQNEGLMAAKGRIDLQGDINIEVGARDIDAAFFAKLFDANLETQGKLSFTAQVSGKTQKPHTAISLEISQGRVANATFDTLYGLFILDQGVIQVSQLMLSKGDYKASAYGTIPLAALNKEGRRTASEADEMDITFRLDQADLSILPFLSKMVVAASGETKGEIKVTGNLFQPRLEGEITVTDGTIQFIDLAESIQKVTVDIQLKDDTIQVRTFEGSVGTGKVQLTGTVAVRDMALHDYDLSLLIDKISLTHKYFKGPVEGRLTLTQKSNRPYLAGNLLLTNNTINVPIFLLAVDDDNSFNMGMDVELVVGDRVRLYNPVLYDAWVEGKVHFGGSLRYPDVSGKIESIRGTLNYLRTQFRINEAVVAFTQFRSFEPVITLQASTRLEQTDVSLAVNGPVSAMDLRLTSNPSMSQQEILSLLTLREKFSERQASGKRDTGIGRDELVSLMESGLQLQFFAEVEDMFRKSLGVDEFRVFRGATNPLFASDQYVADPDQYKIEIGKYITNSLLLRYTTGVDSSERSYGIRYDITKNISLGADIDEFDRLRIGIGMKFRF